MPAAPTAQGGHTASDANLKLGFIISRVPQNKISEALVEPIKLVVLKPSLVGFVIVYLQYPELGFIIMHLQ
jgi:hypothetical protein